MEYKELIKHHTQLIKDQNENKWEVIEASDLEEICEAYHQSKLKEMNEGVGQSEQLPERLCKNNQNLKCNCIDQDRCPNF